MADKVKEEFSLRYTDHHITNLNEQGKPLRPVQPQLSSNTGTNVPRMCTRVNCKSLEDEEQGRERRNREGARGGEELRRGRYGKKVRMGRRHRQ